jgi:hypothetical protein
MAVTASRVTVSSTAVALNAIGTGGNSLRITNTDATATNTVDLGPAGVTAGAGLPLAGGATITVEVDPGDSLYAIRSTATDVVLAILRT